MKLNINIAEMKKMLFALLLFLPGLLHSQTNSANTSEIFHAIEHIRVYSDGIFKQTTVVERFKADIYTQILQQKGMWIKKIPTIVLFLFALGFVYFVVIAQMDKENRTMSFAYVILFFISVLELLYFFALDGNEWFCFPGTVGWFRTIFNFVLYGGIVILQYVVFNMLANRITQRGTYGGYRIGIISAVVAIFILLLHVHYFETSDILHIAGLIILIGGQTVQFVVNVARYGFMYGTTVSLTYMICFSAFLITLAHFLGLLLIVYLGYCLISAFVSMHTDSASDEYRFGADDSTIIDRSGKTYDRIGYYDLSNNTTVTFRGNKYRQRNF